MTDLTKRRRDIEKRRHEYEWMVFRLAMKWTPLTQGEAAAIRTHSLSGAVGLVLVSLAMVVMSLCLIDWGLSPPSVPLWMLLEVAMVGLCSLMILVGTIRRIVLKFKMAPFGPEEFDGYGQ